MFKNKFLNIIDALTEKEIKAFGKFINSPFFNESKRMLEFYDLAKKYYHGHNLNMLTPEIISRYIYKTEQFDSVKTRKLISDFNSLIENFLIHYSVDSDVIGKKAYLSKRLNEKDLNKLYDIEIEDIKKIMNNSKWDSKSYYFSRLKLILEELNAKIYQLTPEKQIERIENLTDSIDRLFTFMKLYVYHIIVQNNFFGDSSVTDYGFVNMETMMNYIGKNISDFYKSEPRIYLFFRVLELIKEGDIRKIYADIEEYIIRNRQYLSPEDIEFNIYTIISFIVSEVNRGKQEDIYTAIEIFKKIESNGFLEKINEFNHYTFIQIVNFAIYAKDVEYAESFIWRYYSKINSFFKEDSLNLALAMLRYIQGRYQEAKDFIKKIKYRTYGFYIMTNGLLLRIYFEENLLNFIHPTVDSFKHYLKRNKNIPMFIKESFMLFFNYLTKLSGIKKGKIKDAYKLEYALSNEKNFYGKKWIGEKLEDIINGINK
jgi:hypothetical protein